MIKTVQQDSGSQEGTVILHYLHAGQKIPGQMIAELPDKISVFFLMERNALSHPDQPAHSYYIVILHNRLDNALQGIPLKHGVCVNAEKIWIL